MRKQLIGLGILLAAGFTTGCKSVAIEDDVDEIFDFTPLVLPLPERIDQIHDPYVTGASFSLAAVSSKDDEDTSKWTMESTASTVITLSQRTSSKGYLSYQAVATAPGTTDIVVKDDGGNELSRHTVHVENPDTALLLFHGPLLLHQPDSTAVTDEARVLEGGTATFQVRWYYGQQLLHGNGALQVAPATGITATTPRTFWFEDRDWLQVTPTSSGGPLTINLSAGTHPVRSFTVIPVQPGDVASMSLHGMDESQAKKKDWLAVLAAAADAQGNNLLGIDYQWDVDGSAQDGVGDLYRYQFDPANTKVLTAKFNGKSASAPIHWGGGFVDSTNNVGCSIGGHGRPTSLALLALVTLLPLARRRRRRG